MIPSLDIAEASERLACCAEDLDEQAQRLQLMLFGVLSEGRPVEPARLAERAGLSVDRIFESLGGWHGVHVDEHSRIFGFQGLSVVETAHRLIVDGRTLYAWCAWDTLFLPELIGRPAEIESSCPATGETITLRVGTQGPADVAPPEAVLTFRLPDARFNEDTIASFCSFIHYFASRHAAEDWTAERPGAFVISIEDGFEIGRRTNQSRWGDALGHPRSEPMRRPRRHDAIKALRAAVRRNDLSALDALLADDVRWSGNFPGGACHNREQVLATLQAQLERGVQPQLEDVQAQGDRALLQVGLSSEAEPTEPGSRLWFALTVDDMGRITELQDYSTKATADRDIALRTRGAAGDPTPSAPVSDLVPFAWVADIDRSVAFYRLLGLTLRETYEHDGQLVWASMAHARAALMLAQSEGPIDPPAQGVLFYLYADDLDGLRNHLVAHGITAGEIVDGSPGPKREMRVTDPDGYCLMVAQPEG